MKKLDFFRKQGVIIKELPGINDDYFTGSEGILSRCFNNFLAFYINNI
ncbi:MAG: hypothetical protein AB1765_10270 [Candidatus Hydrogenedentota bacterium]